MQIVKSFGTVCPPRLQLFTAVSERAPPRHCETTCQCVIPLAGSVATA
jgi:hypothetical protein